jgi:hypothetical protein
MDGQKSHGTAGERMADSDFAKFGNSEQQPPREGTHTNTVARIAGWEERAVQPTPQRRLRPCQAPECHSLNYFGLWRRELVRCIC